MSCRYHPHVFGVRVNQPVDADSIVVDAETAADDGAAAIQRFPGKTDTRTNVTQRNAILGRKFSVELPDARRKRSSGRRAPATMRSITLHPRTPRRTTELRSSSQRRTTVPRPSAPTCWYGSATRSTAPATRRPWKRSPTARDSLARRRHGSR